MNSRATLIHRGPPNRYRLDTERKILDNGKVRKWTHGIQDASKQNKIVLLVGETGAGKTTIINTMVNYILGVKFEEEIWYEITEEEEARDQSESQTSEITMYEIFPRKSPISLTIIDTPGYGDTRGLEKDLEAAENLASLFQSNDGVQEVDAVCFVIQASKNRLSDRQLNIISSILSLFGKDIVNNIVFLITHSDGLPPRNVLGAINKVKIPCRRDRSGQPVYFLFNNRQTEARQTKERYIRAQRDAWDDSMDEMKNFLQSLDVKNRVSLESTTKLLMKHIHFEAALSNIQLRFQENELKKSEKIQIQQEIRQNKDMIDSCTDFFKKTVQEKVPIVSNSWKNRKATTCTVCEENCHEFDCWRCSDPKACEVMKNGFCTVCTGKCHYSKHVKENKKYVSRTSKAVMNFDELKKDNEKAQTKSFSDVMDDLDKDLQVIEDQKRILLFNAYKTIKHLYQIALKPDSASILKHLDFFIPRMREAGKEVWALDLEEMRKRAVAEEANKDALIHLKAGLAKLFLNDK